MKGGFRWRARLGLAVVGTHSSLPTSSLPETLMSAMVCWLVGLPGSAWNKSVSAKLSQHMMKRHAPSQSKIGEPLRFVENCRVAWGQMTEPCGVSGGDGAPPEDNGEWIHCGAVV